MAALLNVCVLGLGEAGKIFAADLAKVASVTGFDPYWTGTADGYTVANSAVESVHGADVVIALTAAPNALELLDSVLDALPSGSVYADFSSASPAQKAEEGRLAEGRVLFADAVLLAPVPRNRIATAVQASGAGSSRLASLLGPLGMNIEPIAGEAGQAAARKLLRSIMVKGLTTLMIESLRAAEAQGLIDWFSDHLVETLTGLDQPFLVRLIEGTLGHSERRIHEMVAAAEMVESTDAQAFMTRAIVEVLKTAPAGIPRSQALR